MLCCGKALEWSVFGDLHTPYICMRINNLQNYLFFYAHLCVLCGEKERKGERERERGERERGGERKRERERGIKDRNMSKETGGPIVSSAPDTGSKQVHGHAPGQ